MSMQGVRAVASGLALRLALGLALFCDLVGGDGMRAAVAQRVPGTRSAHSDGRLSRRQDFRRHPAKGLWQRGRRQRKSEDHANAVRSAAGQRHAAHPAAARSAAAQTRQHARPAAVRAPCPGCRHHRGGAGAPAALQPGGHGFLADGGAVHGPCRARRADPRGVATAGLAGHRHRGRRTASLQRDPACCRRRSFPAAAGGSRRGARYRHRSRRGRSGTTQPAEPGNRAGLEPALGLET